MFGHSVLICIYSVVKYDAEPKAVKAQAGCTELLLCFCHCKISLKGCTCEHPFITGDGPQVRRM